jgi:L-ascorbate metabolism protein UlaG (beta-lactamase superfamily)
MFPKQTVQAAKDLKSKVLFPVHWGKFALANHEWNEPINEVIKHAQSNNLPVASPKIGEILIIDSIPTFEPWWELNKINIIK